MGIPRDCSRRPDSRTLVISDHAELQDISFTKGAGAAGDGTSQLHIPQPGEEIPDVALVNQNGAAHSI